MDETPDPRLEFAGRLQALREAAGLSIRRLEIESARTPRRRNEDAIRLKRSTIAGMTNRERPVRPELANFETFVDTCLRVAAQDGVTLPGDLGDRAAWDEAYRRLRDQLDQRPRRAAPRAPAAAAVTAPADGPEPVTEPPLEPAATDPEPVTEPPAGAPLLTRRRLLFAAPAAALVAGVAFGVPVLLRRDRGTAAEPAGAPPSDDRGYSPVGKLLSPALAVDDPVWSVAVGMLRGDPLAVVGRADGTVQLWNPATGRPRSAPLPGHQKPVFSIALRAPMAVSASVDGTLRRWDLTADPPAGTRLGEQTGAGINSVGFGTVNGRSVAVSAGDDRTVRVWDPATPSAPSRLLGEALDTEVKSIGVGALRDAPIAVTGSADGTMRLWDLAGGRIIRSLDAHDATVGTVAVATIAGRTLAVAGSEDGVVRSWDLAAPDTPGTVLVRIHDAIKTVAIGTVNQRTVAIAGADDNTIRIWDLATGRPYGPGLTGPEKGAEAIAIANLDGHATVVSGHWDGTIWTWSL